MNNKAGLLFKLAEAALANPHGVISEVPYPIASPETLRDLALCLHLLQSVLVHINPLMIQ